MESDKDFRPELIKSFFLMDAAAHSTEAEAERVARSRPTAEGKGARRSSEARNGGDGRTCASRLKAGQKQKVTVTNKEKGKVIERWPRQGEVAPLLLATS